MWKSPEASGLFLLHPRKRGLYRCFAVTAHPFGLLCATNQRLANRSHRRDDSFTTHAIQPSRGAGFLRPPVPVVADITLAFTASLGC